METLKLISLLLIGWAVVSMVKEVVLAAYIGWLLHLLNLIA